ncbi:hypothetical protein ACWCYY_18440 [Kitasatospora sp. NPDC001664]
MSAPKKPRQAQAPEKPREDRGRPFPPIAAQVHAAAFYPPDLILRPKVDRVGGGGRA